MSCSWSDALYMYTYTHVCDNHDLLTRVLYMYPLSTRYFTVVSVRNTSLMELRRSCFLTRRWSTFTLVGRRRPTSLTGHCRRLCHMGTWLCSMQMDRRRSTPRNSRYTNHQFNCVCVHVCIHNTYNVYTKLHKERGIHIHTWHCTFSK